MLSGLLEFGLNEPLLVREERLSARPDSCRLLYISDIHLRRGRTSHLAMQVIESARHSAPDVVLLGGDLVDSSSELGGLQELVEQLAEFGPVLAIGGNHDRRVGFTRVRDAIVSAGGAWIHDSSHEFRHGTRLVSVCGPIFAEPPTGDVRVLCAHNPRIWKSSQHAGYDLVLAGHLHGCQFVAFKFRNRLFPGAVFYPYNYLSHQFATTRLVVSRGVSDRLPIRWRCPREVVLCYV